MDGYAKEQRGGMTKDWLNKRVRIVDVDGMVWHGLPIKTGHLGHVNKEGTIIRDGPVIQLDDGAVVEGCECWWIPIGWDIRED